MSSSTKLSASGKYQVEFLPDPSGCMRTTTTTNYGSGYTKTEQWPKYRLVRLTNLATQTTVFEFKQFTSHPLDCQFFVQSGVEWFFGSREYQSQLFVNLETGDYYDNCTQDYLDDSEYERKHKFDDNSAARNDLFIWVRTCIEPNGMYAVVDGCYWGNSYEDRVYDLSHISTGWRHIYIDLCDRLHMTPNGVIQCYIEGKLVMEATVVDGEISDLGTVTGYAEALQAHEEADY